jgi:hypothetical protein
MHLQFLNTCKICEQGRLLDASFSHVILGFKCQWHYLPIYMAIKRVKLCMKCHMITKLFTMHLHLRV